MTTRLLPVDEWPRLRGTEAERLWPLLTPGRDGVLVAEVDGELVGCVALFWTLHADCVWIAPHHQRRASVARRLTAAIGEAARALGAKTLAIAVRVPVMRKWCAFVGASKLPGEVYVWGLKQVPRS